MPNASILNPLPQDAPDYAQILDASGIGLWEYDHLTGRARVNAPIAAMLGYADADSPTVPDDWFALVHPEDQLQVRARMDAALLPDNPLYEASFRMRRRDGRWLRVRSRGRAIARDAAAGQPLRTAGTLIDIGERDALEQELAGREEDLHLVMDSLDEVFWISDLDLQRIIYINPAYERIWGRPVAELYANPLSFLDAIHPEDLDSFLTELARQRQGLPSEGEYRILRPDGSVRWIWDRSFPVVAPDGSIARSVGLARDISARKHSEDEVRRLNAILEERVSQCATELETSVRQHQESEGRFRDAIAASNVGLWDWHLQTDTVHFSAAFAATLDAYVWELPQCWKDLLHADDRERAIAGTLRELLQSGRCEQEFRFRFRNRGERWILSRGKVVDRDAAGKPLRAIGTLTDIHDLKLAEALNRKLAAIIEASSDMIATASHEGLVDYINPAGRALLGIDPLEPLERARIEAHHPDWAYRRVKEEGIPAALAHGQWMGDTALLGPDGSEIPVSQLILAQPDPLTGQIEYLSTICRDLSERIRANAALQQLQQEQELILDSVPALIWYKDTANRILRVNAAVAQSLGLPKSRIEGHHSAEFYPDDAERYYRDDLIVIETGVPRYGIDEPYRLPSGERRWIRTDKIPLKDAAGRVTCILAMAIDITARKAAEDALRISQDDLSRAQAVGKIGSWRLDVRHDVLIWSAEAHRIFGIPPGESLSYGTFLSTVHPEDREAVDRQWQAALQGEPYDIEHRAIVNGQVKWLRQKAELEFDDRGELLGGFGTTQDITEHKLTEEALRESDRRKDEFIAILAHELRNPLAPIKNAVQILEHPDLDASRLAWLRHVIERQVDSLTKLVDDLLDVSRIGRGKIALRRESLAVADIVAAAVESCQPLIDARRHELILSLPSELPRIDGDPLRLEQVLSNLLNNAATYTEPGGKIQLTVQQEGDEIVVRVTDTGIGISPSMLDKIFDLFVQADRSRQDAQGGLGIGLSLAKQLVTLHGGTLTAASEGAGKGSEFSLRLPLGSERIETMPSVSQSGGAVIASGRRILLADDNPDVLESLAMLLELMGHEVRTARNGLEAVATATTFQPDLILLDLGMPELDGYDTCRRLRAAPSGHAGVMIAAISGWGQDRHKEATRAAGFDRHLVKPVDIGALTCLLNALPAGISG
ncbi:PAS domain-containing protein [Thiocystis violascens]|uniref:histidine kinase n=1 Tax=Thiocystis violascens (strain ATCC 17096 / DSM 198 / 6111) TaxID=765911 RepID=I3YD20_THIV6|nr:PAS domain-containing protein [Thiocystis violascens]AFL74888.1 PAS domain S-box [Thiocystis violascens DSM 198]